MSINVNGVTLPDIPADVLAQYPYAAIYKQTTIVDIGEEYEGTYGEDSTTEIVVLICSKTAHGVATGANLGAEYDGSLTTLEFEPTAITCYEYSSESSVWNTATSNDSYMVMIVNGEKSSEPNELATSTITGELLWSNHDIYELVENDEGALIYGTEIYFPSSVVAEPRIEATRLVTTVTYEGWPETAPTISTNFIDETYPYGALFEDNSTWWIVVSTQPIVYKGSESYNFNTNGNYKVYLWIDTDELRMWYETDGSIWFPIESFYDFSLIWSNHDVLNGTDNSVYFSKTGDVKVTTEEKTISLPAVPTEWVETYPYCCIGEMTVYGTKYCYLTLSTNTCGYIPPSLIEINQSLGGIYIPPCNVVYMYDEATATWVYGAEDVREQVLYDGYTPQFPISGVFWWSNHDIYVLSEDEEEQLVPTDEVYFHGTGVIEPPKEMVVDRIFIVSSAANLRRLTSTTDKLTTDDMITGLSGYTPAADPTLQDITITESGTYTAGEGFDGFGTVTVTEGAVTVITDSDDPVVTRAATSYTNDTITSIGDGAFSYSKLETISCANVKSIGADAFYHAKSLAEVNLPGVESVDEEAFAMCYALTHITLPSLVEAKGFGSTFSYSKALTTADFSLLEKIIGRMFNNCTSLTALILRNTTMATLDNVNAFTNTPIESGTGYIYVPSALVDTYKADSAWSTYAAQFRAIEDYPDICG